VGVKLGISHTKTGILR